MAHEGQNQPYDNVLKRVVEKQAEVILPLLLPELAGKELEQLTVEMLIPHRTGDQVYKTVPSDPNEQPAIIHLEYVVAPTHKTDKTLLIYHASLLEEYEIPVNTYLVLPFRTGGPRPPLIETSRDGRQTLRFDYVVLELWNLDARSFVAQQAVPAYGLLPCMSETSVEMLSEAIEAMVQWYGDRKDVLSDELVCFYTV